MIVYKMLESRALRYVVYGASAIVASEVCYHLFLYVKDVFNKSLASKEICEVIWTNELTQSCVSRHRRLIDNSPGSGSASREGSPTMAELNRIVKLPSPSKTPVDCGNRFCAAYNVGRLLHFIDSAQYTIDLAMYTFTSYDLSQAFNRALKRGVIVRIISDHEMAYSSGSQIIPLTKSGVPIRCNKNTMFMHHKFCIIDSPQRIAALFKKQNKSKPRGYTRGVLVTGSLNWTMQGFGGNWENILITSSAPLVCSYSAEFERMWNAFDFELKKPPASAKQKSGALK